MGVTTVLLLLLGGVPAVREGRGETVEEKQATIHSETAECKKTYVPERCDEVCATCHDSATGITGGNLYAYAVDTEFPGLYETAAEEDPWLSLPPEHRSCRECHEAYAEDEGNHPIFVDSPLDPVLEGEQESSLMYFDGKILCATCHDPHIEDSGLLRMSNSGSALCLKCHRI